MEDEDAARGRLATVSADRRRNPRIELLGRLYGRGAAGEPSLTVTEISLGGMAIETDVELPCGTEHEFQLTLGDDSSVTLRGRVAHSRQLAADPARYLSGIEFVDDPVVDPVNKPPSSA